ncbi:uncharacterized protein LOC144666445 isoform X2 [Oculina patagonica]
MAHNRLLLKVISIVQFVMATFLFTLGMLDGLEIRFIYSSSLFMPCWIAALVIPVGVMGLVLSNMSNRSPALILAMKSVSMACAAVSVITVYHYQQGIGILLSLKYSTSKLAQSYFVDQDTKIKFTSQEKNMLTVFSLVIAFAIIEIALSVASARSCDSGYEPREESQAGRRSLQMEDGQIPLQPTYIATQPMVAIPVSSYNHNVNQ